MAALYNIWSGHLKTWLTIGLAMHLTAVCGWALDMNPTLVGGWNSTNDTTHGAGVVVRGNFAYLTDGDVSLRIINVSNPANPQLVGSYYDPFLIGYAYDLAVSGNFAFVAHGNDGLLVINISNPANPVLTTNIATDAPAYCAHISSGGNIHVGEDQQFEIFSNAANPISSTFLGVYATSGIVYGIRNVIHASVARNFLANDFLGLQVVNTTAANNMRLQAFYDDATYVEDARAVALNPAGTHVFLADAVHGLQIINVGLYLTNLWTRAGGLEVAGAAYGLALSANGNIAYVASEVGLQIIDVTTQSSPKRIGQFPTADPAFSVAVTTNYAYVAADGLYIIDITRQANPPRLTSFTTTDSANAVAVSSNLVFVANGDAGLTILGNLNNLQFVTNYDTVTPAHGVSVMSNYVFVAEAQGGLDVFDVSVLTNVVITNGFAAFANNYASSIAISTNYDYAFLANGNAGLYILDITGLPDDLTEVATIATNAGFVTDVTLSGNHAYVAAGNNLTLFNISNPASPFQTGTVNVGAPANSVKVSGNYAYVAASSGGMRVVDISNPANPKNLGLIAAQDTVSDVVVSGNFAYVADGAAGVGVIDIRYPTQLKRVGGNSACNARGLTIASNRLFVASGGTEVAVMALFRPIEIHPPFTVVSNTFRFWLTGPTNQTIRVQSSTNLTTWTDLQTLTLTTTSPREIIGTNFSSQVRRFYRAVTP